MKELNALFKENKILIIFWTLLILMALLNMLNFSFISQLAEYIYYGVYFLFTFLLIFTIFRKTTFRISHLILVLINFLAIIISVKNEYIALAMLLIYPLLASKKSKLVFKILSAFSYFIAVIWIVFFLTFLRIVFKPIQIKGELTSPNNKYNLVIVSSDQGATGGNTNLYLDKKYLKLFKYRKIVDYDYSGRKEDIKWIDNKTFKIRGERPITVNSILIR